jgi:histidyl-tRNA synthetase
MGIKAIKGTKDILPVDSPAWRRIEESSRKIFGLFGYHEIRTPIMEETELFSQTIGEDTDIVKKEMFSFVDRGERNITLRPEGTAPIVRSYLENNLDKTEGFQKLCYIGPMFRAERPQAGRLRQFHQIGAEAIGSIHPALDAEIISLMVNILEATGVKKYQLKLNNLGCREDKKKLSKLLKTLFSAHQKASLCDDCKRRLETNPLRVLDCKKPDCKMIVRGVFKGEEFLCDDCKAHFAQTLAYLDSIHIPYIIDPYIVRGLDYYTRTVFEVTHAGLGSQDALGAGGRYDNLMRDMGGPELGACGFALGVERLMLALEGSGSVAKKDALDAFIATIGKGAYAKAFALLDELRKAGVACDMDYEDKSLKAQMRSADKSGAPLAIIVGEDELAKGEAVVRDMRTNEQAGVKLGDLVNTVKEKLK